MTMKKHLQGQDAIEMLKTYGVTFSYERNLEYDNHDEVEYNLAIFDTPNCSRFILNMDHEGDEALHLKWNNLYDSYIITVESAFGGEYFIGEVMRNGKTVRLQLPNPITHYECIPRSELGRVTYVLKRTHSYNNDETPGVTEWLYNINKVEEVVEDTPDVSDTTSNGYPEIQDDVDLSFEPCEDKYNWLLKHFCVDNHVRITDDVDSLILPGLEVLRIYPNNGVSAFLQSHRKIYSQRGYDSRIGKITVNSNTYYLPVIGGKVTPGESMIMAYSQLYQSGLFREADLLRSSYIASPGGPGAKEFENFTLPEMCYGLNKMDCYFNTGVSLGDKIVVHLYPTYAITYSVEEVCACKLPVGQNQTATIFNHELINNPNNFMSYHDLTIKPMIFLMDFDKDNSTRLIKHYKGTLVSKEDLKEKYLDELKQSFKDELVLEEILNPYEDSFRSSSEFNPWRVHVVSNYKADEIDF